MIRGFSPAAGCRGRAPHPPRSCVRTSSGRLSIRARTADKARLEMLGSCYPQDREERRLFTSSRDLTGPGAHPRGVSSRVFFESVTSPSGLVRAPPPDERQAVPLSVTVLGLRAVLLRSVRERGQVVPTAVRAWTIPATRPGRDLTRAARAGAGRTAACALPLLPCLMRLCQDARPATPAMPLVESGEIARRVTADVQRCGALLPSRCPASHVRRVPRPRHPAAPSAHGRRRRQSRKPCSRAPPSSTRSPVGCAPRPARGDQRLATISASRHPPGLLVPVSAETRATLQRIDCLRLRARTGMSGLRSRAVLGRAGTGRIYRVDCEHLESSAACRAVLPGERPDHSPPRRPHQTRRAGAGGAATVREGIGASADAGSADVRASRRQSDAARNRP